MSSRTLIIIFLMCYSYRSSYAAITPLDETYTATVDEEFTIPWVYDNEADMNNVDWGYKSQSATTAVTIMTKSPTNPAVVTSGYDVEHDIAKGNGNIKLIPVKANSTGIYFCTVTYKLSSGRPIVTGTATLLVTSATTTAAPDRDGGCDAGCIAGICVGVVFLLFIIGCIVGCVKAALVEDEDNFKWILLSCIIIVGLGILTVMGIRRCLNKCEKDAGKEDNATEKPKAKPGAHSVNPHSNQATTVAFKNEHNDHGSKVRPQPSPPGGAKGTSTVHGREGSDSAVSRQDVELLESGSHLTKRPVPAITPGHDSKGRGLSANFDDKDHPLEYIETPAQRKGALGALVEDTGEGSKKVKKKKKKSNKDRDLNEDEE